MFRKKSKYDVAREQLEASLHDLINQTFEQGEQLRQLIAERAPEIRDRIADELPESVVSYLPESAKPAPKRKRSRLKKAVFVSVVLAGGAAVAAVVMDRGGSTGSYDFDEQPAPRTAPTSSTTSA